MQKKKNKTNRGGGEKRERKERVQDKHMFENAGLVRSW